MDLKVEKKKRRKKRGVIKTPLRCIHNGAMHKEQAYSIFLVLYDTVSQHGFGNFGETGDVGAQYVVTGLTVSL